MKLRLKEINPAYDSFFGKGKGWIFVTEAVSIIYFFHLLQYSVWRENKTGFKHKIVVI